MTINSIHPDLLLRRGRYADLEIHAMMSVTFCSESLHTFFLNDFRPQSIAPQSFLTVPLVKKRRNTDLCMAAA